MGAPRSFKPGDMFRKLRIVRLLGRGAFANVYLAEDTQLERFVALKVFGAPGIGVQPEAGDRTLAEARLVVRLKSPHVVTLYQVHELEDGGWIFEMEYVDGGSLEGLLEKQPHPAPERSLEILRGIARGLEAAHAAGIVHGDIKPANVLLDRAGTAKLADFGLARMHQDPGLSMTSTGGELVGTPRYMAPEVVMGDRPTPASDFWSFGVILYQFLAGVRPFEGPTLHSLFNAILNAPTPALDERTPEQLAELATHCLSKRAEDRPRVFGEVVRVLERVTPKALVPPAEAFPIPEVAVSLFGRETETTELERLLGEVAEGEGRAVLVTGEAGIGKTTLVAELARRAAKRDFGYIEARITLVEGLVRPLLQEIRRNVSGGELSERFGPSARLLRNVLREESEVLQAPEQLAWVVERLLQGMAESMPIVVLVEDAHLAQPDEMRLIGELGVGLGSSRVLLVVTYRTHDPGESKGSGELTVHYRELTARPEFRHIDLGPLPTGAILRMLESDYDGTALAPAVARHLTQLAEGNPLYAKELLSHLLEQRAVVRAEESIEPGPAWEERYLPRRVHDLVMRRLQGLTEDERFILDVAAVDGQEFDGEAVAAVHGTPLLKVLRILQKLYRDRGLVRPRPTGHRFSHAVIQEVIHGEIAQELRTEIHRRLAEHLETRGPEAAVDAERIGTHWERGGELDRAVPYLAEAARTAGHRQELQRTIDLCNRAGLVPGKVTPDEAIRYARTLFQLATAYTYTKPGPEPESVYELLLSAAAEKGDEVLRLRTLARGALSLYWTRGAEAVDEEELRRASDLLPDSADRGLARYALGVIARRRGDYEEAREWLLAADEVFLAIGHDGYHASTLDSMGGLMAHAGDHRAAVQLHAESAEISRRAGRLINASIAEVNHAVSSLYVGPLEGLDARLERTIRDLELRGLEGHLHQARIILAHVLYAKGDLRAARRCAEDACLRLEHVESLPAISAAHLAAAELANAGGDLEDAERHLTLAREAAAKTQDRSALGTAALLHAQRLCLAGDLKGSADAARKALDLLGRSESGQDVTDVVMRLAESTLYGMWAEVLDDLEPLRGRISSFCGGFVDGCHAYHSSVAPPDSMEQAAHALLADEVGERRATLRILGRWLRAAALRRRGQLGQAEQTAREALEAATALGHLGQQLGLLALLHEWTGDPGLQARRSGLLAGLR